MSEMIDRVAKALVEKGGIDGGTERLARIAIETMREPTEAMLDAGNHTAGVPYIWQDMIDEALK